MNDKRKMLLITFAMFTIAASCIFTACCSRPTTGSNRSIIEHQREIDRLESTVEQYDIAMRNATERLGEITNRSKSMEGTVDEVIVLFDEYQRAIEQFIHDYNKIRNENKDID